MKLDQQCGVCRSYTWCGRMCRHAPTIYEAPGLAEKPVQAVSKRKALAKPKKTPTEGVPDSSRGKTMDQFLEDTAKQCFDRKAYQREYMRRRRAEAKAKPVKG